MPEKKKNKYQTKSGLRFLYGINPQAGVDDADKMEPKKKKGKPHVKKK